MKERSGGKSRLPRRLTLAGVVLAPVIYLALTARSGPEPASRASPGLRAGTEAKAPKVVPLTADAAATESAPRPVPASPATESTPAAEDTGTEWIERMAQAPAEARIGLLTEGMAHLAPEDFRARERLLGSADSLVRDEDRAALRKLELGELEPSTFETLPVPFELKRQYAARLMGLVAGSAPKKPSAAAIAQLDETLSKYSPSELRSVLIDERRALDAR